MLSHWTPLKLPMRNNDFVLIEVNEKELLYIIIHNLHLFSYGNHKYNKK